MLSPELDIDMTIVSLILFAVIALFVRPPMKIVVFALIGGVVFAALNMVSDMIAYWADWWRFPFVQDRYPSLMFYIPALFFYGAGVAGLIGWWLRNKFGNRSAIIFLPLVAALVGLVRPIVEWIVKSGTIMVLRNDVVSYLALYLDCLLLSAVAYLVVLGLERISKSKSVVANHPGLAV
jgi:hypothetical protein